MLNRMHISLKSFDFSLNREPSAATAYYLDLGNVKNMARVSLNGKVIATLWTSPWRIDITSYLRESRNELVIEVVNLWVNRLIGDEYLPYDGITEDGKWPQWLVDGKMRTSGRYTFATTREYANCKESDYLSESGLLGPVRILGMN